MVLSSSYLSVGCLFVVGVLQVVHFLEHIYLVDSLLHLCRILVVYFSQQTVHVYDAVNQLRFGSFAYVCAQRNFKG